MINIRSVYEIAIRVNDLSKSEIFYCKVLGLKVGLRDKKRNWLFLQTKNFSGMIVLQEDRGTWPSQHLAFTILKSEIEQSAEQLRENGISVKGPVLHEWVPMKSIYFEDPNGHDLELCAVLSKN